MEEKVVVTDKELKRLSRIELLEIIHILQQSEQRLLAENSQLKEELYGRRELLAETGTFADAADALDAAVKQLQVTAKQYQLLLESESSKLISGRCSSEGERKQVNLRGKKHGKEKKNNIRTKR